MTVKTVDAKTLRLWLEQSEAVLIDVREPEEYTAKNIPSAKSIPLGSLCENNLPDTDGKKLVLHCGGGGRAGRACEKLLSENPDIEVYNLTGGLRSWAASGYEVNENAQDGPVGNFCSTKK
jgi:rhodanese-related sulfurtransferase